MIISSKAYGSYTKNRFNISLLKTAPFVPLYLLHKSNLFVENGVFFYYTPDFESNKIRRTNTLNNIKKGLEHQMTPFEIQIGAEIYYFIKGCMYNQSGKPMLTLALKQEFLDSDPSYFSEDKYSFSSKYVLFYASEFFTTPRLASLHRRLQKEILTSCFEKSIEVRILTSSEIEKNTFVRLFEVVKAKSISQLENYMNTVLSTALYTEEEDTFVAEDLPEFNVPQLPIEEEALLYDATPIPEETAPEWDAEYEMEREDLEREAATWSDEDSAHTDSSYVISTDFISDEVTVLERTPHPVNSIVGRRSRSQEPSIVLIDDTE